MAGKPDPRIDAYIAQAESFARPILRHLRQLVQRGCPEAQETLKWSHPSFVSGGRILCGFAAFKAHATFGFWHQEMEKVIARERGTTDEAMGLMGRLTRLTDLPDDQTMLRYLRMAAELNAAGKPGRPHPAAKPKPELPVPSDLAAALKQDKAAATTFAKFSPSQRREYIEWITEAKRDETRQKRLATALGWLAEGKARNWKYMNC